MTWWQYLISALTVVGSAVIARYTSRSADRATEATSRVQHEANAVEGFDRLTERLEADSARLRQEVESLRRDHNALSRKHDELRRHVSDLERQRVKDRALIRHLITYARTLRDELRRRQLAVPDGPGGLDLDDLEVDWE